MTKKAEARVRDLTNHYEWYKHKYGDVRYCIHCQKPLPKTERAPDFYVSQIGDWIEAKNNDATGSWRCAEIMEGGERSGQREFLNENGGWLFIELADGNAPVNASAYLIDWDSWLHVVEPILIHNDMKSIRRETTHNNDASIRRLGADELLYRWKLDWEAGTGWFIPYGHDYWHVMMDKLEGLMILVRGNVE